MKPHRLFLVAATALLLAALPGRGAPSAAPAPAQDPALEYFGDTILVDQDGREQRLYTDLMKDRIVLIHVGFIRCTSICPSATASLKKIQDRLGDRLGRDVHILSITIDPEHDTPALLKEHAAHLEARPGWHLLTGTPEHVETVLRKLGLWAAAPEKHPAVLIFGNLRTGLWKKAFAMAGPDEVVAVAESVIDDQGGEL